MVEVFWKYERLLLKTALKNELIGLNNTAVYSKLDLHIIMEYISNPNYIAYFNCLPA